MVMRVVHAKEGLMHVVYELTDTHAARFRLVVAYFYGLTVAELMNGKRIRRLVSARRAGMWAARTLYRLSLQRSATLMGRNDAATARGAVLLVKAMCNADLFYRAELDRLARVLAERIPPPPST